MKRNSTTTKAKPTPNVTNRSTAKGPKAAPPTKAKPVAKAAPKPTTNGAAGRPRLTPTIKAEIEAAARRGKLPEPPDFSAKTHTRFRPKLARLIALAQAGDIEGLRNFHISPISTSPKAMDRYRNLCVMALEARAAANA